MLYLAAAYLTNALCVLYLVMGYDIPWAASEDFHKEMAALCMIPGLLTVVLVGCLIYNKFFRL